MEVRHQNNFGLLRLTFALLVIMSHSFELIDGNRLREPLTRIFGTVSFGELAVDGFFIISGYLVTQSLVNSSSITSFLKKRSLRIYPGFSVAFVVCYFAVAPLGGADLSTVPMDALFKLPAHIAVLQRPALSSSVFSTLPYADLNGSMWTIVHEFRCYLLLAWFWLITCRPLAAVVVASGAALLLYIGPHILREAALREPDHALRFAVIFASGVLYYALRAKIRFTNRGAAIAALILLAALFNPWLAEPAIAILGAYIIFWFAFLPNARTLNRINSQTDISYGTYLYAWPIQSLMIWYWQGEPNPWAIAVLTSVAAMSSGYVSWILVERRFIHIPHTVQFVPL